MRTEQGLDDDSLRTQRARFSWLAWMGIGLVRRVPPLQRLGRLLRYRYWRRGAIKAASRRPRQ